MKLRSCYIHLSRILDNCHGWADAGPSLLCVNRHVTLKGLILLPQISSFQVNCTQMACLLGQVDLESGRPPMQMSGATLPECKPYVASPHAGGFIDHRILSSYNIRDYIFHSMAGREVESTVSVFTTVCTHLRDSSVCAIWGGGLV